MKFIQGQNRTQTSLFPISIDEAIDHENEVRLIDMFVDKLDLVEFGFDIDFDENGRPAYHPADLLKLFIYGYMNRIRSSRQLEKECKRNIEAMWLMKCLAPDHNTISNFRRDNKKAIKGVFRQTVKMAQYFNLIGGTLIAGDSTKLRAQNSKKNNYNQKKIDRHLAYIDNKLDEYQKTLEENDGDKQEVEKEIKKQKEHKDKYRVIEKKLAESGQSQISTSDPDSRHLITRNNITEVAYTAQTIVDADNNIPIDYKITNSNSLSRFTGNKKAMGNMLRRTKSILRHNSFTALFDKGYHTGSELAIADSLHINTIVAIPTLAGASHAPHPDYDVENFTYNNVDDTYTCPQGHILTSNKNWHNAKNSLGEVSYRFKNYTTPKCKTCKVRELCTKSAANGKQVRRSEYTQNIENNKNRLLKSEKIYKRRQAIVEHPYGTIKRQWGFNYIITKKYFERAEADFGLIMTAYNLRRIFNIVGIKKLMKHLSASYRVFKLKNTILKQKSSFFNQSIIKLKNYNYFATTA